MRHREGGGRGNHNGRCALLIVGGEGRCAANNSVTVALPLNPPPVLRDSRQLRVHGGRGDGASGAQLSAIGLTPFGELAADELTADDFESRYSTFNIQHSFFIEQTPRPPEPAMARRTGTNRAARQVAA